MIPGRRWHWRWCSWLVGPVAYSSTMGKRQMARGTLCPWLCITSTSSSAMTLARGLQSSGGHMGTRLGISQGCLWTICTDHKVDLKGYMRLGCQCINQGYMTGALSEQSPEPIHPFLQEQGAHSPGYLDPGIPGTKWPKGCPSSG